MYDLGKSEFVMWEKEREKKIWGERKEFDQMKIGNARKSRVHWQEQKE